MKISKWLLIFVFMMTGCRNQENDLLSFSGFEAVSQGDYTIIMPEVHGDARLWHSQVLSNKDMMNLGERMQELCKSYFSPHDYALTPGTVLSRQDIIELQRRSSESSPWGLNPPEGIYQVDDTMQLKSPYLICDLVELNFISLNDQNQRQIAVVLVMNPVDGMSDADLMHAGLDASEKLIQYLRDVKQIQEQPLILIYTASELNCTLPGRFLAIYDDSTEILEEEWVYLPSERAEKLDSVLCDEFEQLKDRVKQFLPEHVDLIGEVFFEKNVATELRIDVNVQAKTYTEMNALAQCLASSIKEMNNTAMTIVCQIKVLDTTLFVLMRRQNQDEVMLIKL